LTPKPGLVDLRGSGAHRDLNWALMCRSACVLHSTFHAMAVAGALAHDLPHDSQALREELGQIGRDGEAAMLHATDGVNTHRGAIWALGLLVSAAAQGEADAETIAARAGAIARLHDRFAPRVTGNKGERTCCAYGISGARGEAMAGFPHVVKVALPCLHATRARGDREDHAQLNALLAVMVDLDDTCILSRGGMPALLAMQAGAHAVLAAGGVGHENGAHLLRQLEQHALASGVSPGGAADLLAAALFLDRLTSEHLQ
jgi:triphosphoribosyl-dephospho-CoA synthase